MIKSNLKAVKCNGKRCKEVFHVYENYVLGGINDTGFILSGDRFVASLFAWMPMHVMHRVVNASEKNGSFPGRLLFSPHICYFSCVLFGDKRNFRIFAGSKGCRPHKKP